jgi:DNA-binding MarR family transcriptional regulator
MSEGDRASIAPPDPARALAGLRELIGFHVSLANTAIKAHFQKNFAGLGLTQKQIAVLWLVDGCPGIIQVDLARMLRVKRASISAMVRGLCARGLMARKGPGDVDARHVPLTLTSAGESALCEAKRAIESHEAWVKEHYSRAEQRTIAALMTKLHQNLG